MENPTQRFDPDLADPAEVTLARSVVYEALAIALQDPAQVLSEKLRDPEVSSALVTAAVILDTLPAPAAGSDGEPRGLPKTSSMEHQARALTAVAAQTPTLELSMRYQKLFGHTARGKVTAYETEYGVGAPFGQTQELADIGGFYEAFGLQIGKKHQERCDHIAVELEFMAFLCRKENYLATVAPPEASQDVRQAERLFLTDHLSGFGRTFATSMTKETDDPFYRAVAALLNALLLRECEHWGLDTVMPLVPLRSASEDDVPMACGSCELRQPTDSMPG